MIRRIIYVCLFIVLQLLLYKSYGFIAAYRSWTSPYQVHKVEFGSQELPVVTLGFIGDSNTVRGNPTAALTCKTALEALSPVHVSIFNAGRGGKTTMDWRPDSPEGHLGRAIAAFKKAGVKYVLVTLGTNPSEFEESCRAICLSIKGNSLIPVLNYPPYNPGLNDEGKETLAKVTQSIDKLVGEGVAMKGDTEFYSYMMRHPDQSEDNGIHPTQPALNAMGTLWAKAIKPYIDQDLQLAK